MVADATTPPALFTPSDALADQIVYDLAEPTASLASVAAAHNIPLAALSLWLSTPAARARMLTVERGGYAHTRMAAALQLSAAVHTLTAILDDFRKNPQVAPSSAPSTDMGSLSARASSSWTSPSAPLPLSPSAPSAHSASSAPSSPPPTPPRSSDPSAASAFSSLRLDLRRAENARRACYHLYRLSRITPIDEDRIAHARALRHERAHEADQSASRAAGSPRTTNASETKTLTDLAHTTRSVSASASSAPASPSAPLPLRPSAPQPSSSSPRSSASSALKSSSPSRPSRSRSPAALLIAAGVAPSTNNSRALALSDSG